MAALEDKGLLGKTLAKFGDVRKAKAAIEAVRGGEAVNDADAERPAGGTGQIHH